MRGSQSIYRDLFNEQVPEVAATAQPTLRDQRNECILDYYYYHGRKETMINGKPTRMSYTSLLEVVGAAFFLSTFTVHDIISKSSDQMALLKQEWKDRPVMQLRKHLEGKWSMFVWD